MNTIKTTASTNTILAIDLGKYTAAAAGETLNAEP